MAQTKTNQRWAEIDSVIKEHKAELKAAESHTVLRDFAGAKVNIVVEVQVTEDDTALRMAETPGWQSWKDSDITSLLVDQEDE